MTTTGLLIVFILRISVATVFRSQRKAQASLLKTWLMPFSEALIRFLSYERGRARVSAAAAACSCRVLQMQLCEARSELNHVEGQKGFTVW